MVYNILHIIECNMPKTQHCTRYIPYIGICYIRVTLLLSMIENCDVEEEEEEEKQDVRFIMAHSGKFKKEITTLSPHHELNFLKNVLK